MSTEWRKFISITFPIVLISIALFAEVISYFLRDVPLRRHDLDRLVIALKEGEAMNAPIVLLGDSITQDVLKSYRIAPKGKVANLTTNQASGVVGSMFLLERYLEKNNPPEMIVFSATPEFFGYDPEGKAAEVYLTSVFSKTEEQEWLLKNMRSVFDYQKIEPAILNIEGRIGYKLLALFASTPDGLTEKGKIPDKTPTLESSPIHSSVQRGIDSRADKPIFLSKIVETALTNICKMTSNTELYIVIAPMPKTTYLKRKKEGEINKLKDMLINRLDNDCKKINFIDINEYRVFPDIAMRDANHLRRPGWTTEYAILLKQIILKLESYSY